MTVMKRISEWKYVKAAIITHVPGVVEPPLSGLFGPLLIQEIFYMFTVRRDKHKYFFGTQSLHYSACCCGSVEL